MSKGTQIYPLRIADAMMIDIVDAIKSANKSRRGEEYNISSWIRSAIQEKIDHRRRSKQGKRNANQETAPG